MEWRSSIYRRARVCRGVACDGDVAGRTRNFTRRWRVDRPQSNDRSDHTRTHRVPVCVGSVVVDRGSFCVMRRSHYAHVYAYNLHTPTIDANARGFPRCVRQTRVKDVVGEIAAGRQQI